ncbi:S-adenosyl-L-methionine-dependent methyltransferase [Lipomyces kononenkoae]|uniref:S-adenosyl-L-methionine-dependent methyltransferase n=1 Tax=Lipomyces kononenkoae TaxID=34357 RepID=A0ACC3SRS8_LIPKO
MASDLAAQNRAHFNQVASTYDSDFEDALRSLANAVQARRDWIGVDWDGPVKVLDYACGTGVISRALEPYATKLIGLDVSEEMVAKYNAHARALGSNPEKMSALIGNLTDKENPPLEQFSDSKFFDFDLIVVGMALHHMEDPTYAISRLGERLKKGGVLLVIDKLLPLDIYDAEEFIGDAMKTSRHRGFAKGQVTTMFKEAGIDRRFDIVVLKEPIYIRRGALEMKWTLFFAKGERV